MYSNKGTTNIMIEILCSEIFITLRTNSLLLIEFTFACKALSKLEFSNRSFPMLNVIKESRFSLFFSLSYALICYLFSKISSI